MSFEMNVRRSDGEEVALTFPATEIIADLDLDPQAMMLCYIAHRHAVHEEAALARAKYAEELATTDHVTGLLSRRGFESVYASIVPGLVRSIYGTDTTNIGSLIAFDLDKFKDVNDTLGHDAGDRVLQQVANIMTTVFREGDVLARFGGDEFACFLPNTSTNGAIIVADKLRKTIEEETRVTSSIGVSPLAPGLSLESGMQMADKLMYDAKALGGNNVVSQSEFINQNAQNA